MAAYRIFTSPRMTEADIPSLEAALRVQDPTAGVQHKVGEPTYVVKKNTAWTAPQISVAQSILDTVSETTPALVFARTSKGKDLMATMALLVRDKNPATWAAMTLAEKTAAAQAEADVWANLRNFIETAGL